MAAPVGRVAAAHQLRVSDGGDLIYVSGTGTELAVYQPSPPPLRADTRLVTSADDVLGNWHVIEVAGASPPADTRRGLLLERDSNVYDALYLSACSGETVTWTIARRGRYEVTERAIQAMGCRQVDHHTGGPGVVGATQLRLTTTGDLIYVNRGGVELAVYRRDAPSGR